MPPPTAKPTAPGKRHKWRRLAVALLLLFAATAIGLTLRSKCNAIKLLRTANAEISTEPGSLLRTLPSGWTTWLHQRLGHDRLAPLYDVVGVELYAFDGGPDAERLVARSATFNRLHTFEIFSRSFTDQHLALLIPCRQLQQLGLTRASVSGQGLRHLHQFPELWRLTLSDASVTDADLRHLEGLNQLHTLELDGTEITDAGMPSVATLAGLDTLSLPKAITDEGLRQLVGLTQLNSLSLSFCEITDRGLPHLYAMKKLRWITLTGTRVTAAGRQQLNAALPNLIKITP